MAEENAFSSNQSTTFSHVVKVSTVSKSSWSSRDFALATVVAHAVEKNLSLANKHIISLTRTY